MPAAEQACGLPRARHRDADDAEDAAAQPYARAQAGDVPGSVWVVGHEQRLRAVAAGDAEQIGACLDGDAATLATSTGSGPPMRNTSAPRSSALRFRWNFSTFPPPDFGFIIRYGCRAGGWVVSGHVPVRLVPAQRQLPVMLASNQTAADSTAIHNRSLNA